MSAGTCFVIPAAGRGSRLGIDVPKILAPVTPRRSVWSLLRDRMDALADHLHVIVSPEGRDSFAAEAGADLKAGAVSVSLQLEPRGMGDAIFGAREHWERYRDIFVLWGDQLGISPQTLKAVVTAQSRAKGAAFTLPVVWAERPYVQYQFDAAGLLTRILQSREGDACEPAGFSDVGLFGLSTSGLVEAWAEFDGRAALGKSTGEKNFLPFLSFLSVAKAWPVQRIQVANPGEARGVNTPEDLAFFAKQLEETEGK